MSALEQFKIDSGEELLTVEDLRSAFDFILAIHTDDAEERVDLDESLDDLQQRIDNLTK